MRNVSTRFFVFSAKPAPALVEGSTPWSVARNSWKKLPLFLLPNRLASCYVTNVAFHVRPGFTDGFVCVSRCHPCIGSLGSWLCAVLWACLHNRVCAPRAANGMSGKEFRSMGRLYRPPSRGHSVLRWGTRRSCRGSGLGQGFPLSHYVRGFGGPSFLRLLLWRFSCDMPQLALSHVSSVTGYR